MTLLGQPESYSDMLKRIFAATFIMGVVCIFALAAGSPTMHSLLEMWSLTVSVGPVDNVKMLYVLIPLVAAVLARVFFVHNKLSDLFGIRMRFDIENILKPLAVGVGIPTTGSAWDQIENNRELAMTRTFYRYASFKDPQIDVQLVRSAADRWAWFWCTIEPQIILFATAIALAILGAWIELFAILAVAGILALIAILLWPQLRAGARNQIAEILTMEDWKSDVRAALQNLAKVQVPAP